MSQSIQQSQQMIEENHQQTTSTQAPTCAFSMKIRNILLEHLDFENHDEALVSLVEDLTTMLYPTSNNKSVSS